ncbi:MAG: ParA family protein [Eggerthellaceae bacterium]
MVDSLRLVATKLRLPVPSWRILRTCVPGRMTNAEAVGEAILDRFFPDQQFRTVIHESAKVKEGSWEWKPIVEFMPGNRAAVDYGNLGGSLGYGTSRRHRQALQPGGRARRGQAGEAEVPVEEIEVAAIEDHPANVAYSMDEDGIKASRSPSGRTAHRHPHGPPKARRRLPDAVGTQAQGGLRAACQGRPRVRAHALPHRRGRQHDQAVTLLHTANYFTRELNVIERAKATRRSASR